MAGERSYARLGASARDLDVAAVDRWEDAEALFQAGRYASSIAMAAYALEIRLKERICRRLDLRALPKPLEIHDLEGLLVLAGLSRRLNRKSVRDVKRNWSAVRETAQSLNELRYLPGGKWTRQQASDFLDQLRDPHHGVLTWISIEA